MLPGGPTSVIKNIGFIWLYQLHPVSSYEKSNLQLLFAIAVDIITEKARRGMVN